jgi:hypothetical protein
MTKIYKSRQKKLKWRKLRMFSKINYLQVKIKICWNRIVNK